MKKTTLEIRLDETVKKVGHISTNYGRMAESVLKLREKARRMVDRMDYFGNSLKDMQKILETLDKDEIIGKILDSKSLAAEIHRKYRSIHLQTIVISELSYFAKQMDPSTGYEITMAIIYAMDAEEESWWLKRDNFTLAQWYKEAQQLVDRYKKERESRITTGQHVTGAAADQTGARRKRPAYVQG